MFATKRLASISLRATTRGFLGVGGGRTTLQYAPVSTIITRSYATPRRGASSRPVKYKEPTRDTSNADIQPRQEEQQSNVSSQQYQQAPAEDYYARYGGATAAEVVNQSVSLQAFLKRSMMTTAAGVGISAVATAAFIQMPFVYAHPYLTLGAGVLGSIGALIGLGATPPTYVQEGEIVKAVNSPARQAIFGTLLVSEGLMLAPSLAIVTKVAPMAIPIAGSLAAATMAGMMAYSLKQPQGSLAKWGPALYVGLFGLIGVSVVNMFMHSSALTMATSAIGIGIFAAFTAYDTHTAIDDHNEGRPDHLLTAANFYLNFVNLFMDYLRLILNFFDD